MTPLRQRMLEDLRVRNYAVKAQTMYVQRVARFAAYFGRSPDQLYDGRKGSFSTDGLSGSPNIAAMRRQLAYYVARALAVSGFACYAMGFGDLGDEMKSANRDFCASSGRQRRWQLSATWTV